MPTIKVSKEEFESYVGKKLPLEKLKDRISMMGTDLDSIEGNEINVEIFPNRPDMLSLQGFARAFSSFIGEKTGLRHYKVEDSKEKVIIDKSLKTVRPYTACAIVKGMKFDDEKIKEAIQIQEKLHVTYGRNRKKAAIGIYPFEKIKPPIRFLAKKPEDIVFRPLEWHEEINAAQILARHPTGKEYAHLVEGLDKLAVFIDADDNVLSVPPIINSHMTGKITESTTDVFIECSGYDFEVLKKCLNIIVTAFADMGGKIYSMTLEYPDGKQTTPNLDPEEIKLDLDYINKILGLNLNKTQAKELLERMGYGYKEGNVLVPAYRADIIHQIDFAEDIAIAYGYENFEEIIPAVATIGQEDSIEILKSKIASILIGMGMIECCTYNLTSRENQLDKMNYKADIVGLKNSLSKEYDVLRAWVIPNMLEVLGNNRHNDYPQNIFGFGTVFKKDESQETNILENERLAAALCEESADYTKIRQAFDYLMSSLGLEYDVIEEDHPSMIPGRSARIKVKGKKIAYIGEISPDVLSRWELAFPVAAFEINVSELLGIITK